MLQQWEILLKINISMNCCDQVKSKMEQNVCIGLSCFLTQDGVLAG